MRPCITFWLVINAAIVLVFAGGADDALAQSSSNNTLDSIVRLYRDHAAQWEHVIKEFAVRLFWLLAAIEFSWAAIWLALKGADFSEWVAEVVNQVLFIGFFLTVLLHSSEWAGAIVQSFRTAADNASAAAGGSQNITPSNVFDVGLNLASKVWDTASFWHPGDSVGLMILVLVILICFALIVAFMILALVESYVVISAGVLLMGFGGSRWTKDFAIKIIVYAVSVGAKLFVLQLLIGLGQRMIEGWVDSFESSNADIFIVVGSAIVMLALTKGVPDMVQSLINGTSLGSGSALVSAAAAAGGAAAGAVASIAGVGMATHGAGKLASEQLHSAELAGTLPASRAGRLAAFTGYTLKNLGAATLEDVGRRLGGRAHYGTAFGRMSEALHQRARDVALERRKPQPPTVPAPQSGPQGKNTRQEESR